MFISGVNNIGDKREKSLAMHFFHILFEFTLHLQIDFLLSFHFQAQASWYCQQCLIIGGVIDTGKQFFGGVVEIGDKCQAFLLFLTGINNFIDGVIDGCDDRGLFFLQNYEPLGKNNDAAARRQQYLRPPGSDRAADDVIGTTMKRRIHRHPTQPDQRPLRPPKLLQTKMGLSPSAEVGHSCQQFHFNRREKMCPQTQHTP